MARKVQGLGPSLCAPIQRSAWRDCLETPDGVHYGIPRDCATVRTSTFSALRATKRGPIRPAQRLSRQSLEGVFSEVQLTRRGCAAKEAGLPGATSSQTATTKNDPKVRLPNGKAWSKVRKY